MSFDLKTTFQPESELSPQHKKLNALIAKIEQQKLELDAWEKSKNDIQQHARKTLVPIYAELHLVLFEQLEHLWNSLSSNDHDFSKADLTQLDEKNESLAYMLEDSQSLNSQQLKLVDEISTFYEQYAAHKHNKKTAKKWVDIDEASASNAFVSDFNEVADDTFEEWDSAQYAQAREQAKLKKQLEKREQALKMAEQSLKTVYLKIAAQIHPDREQDESIKIKKNEMLQGANEAYKQQDLLYLLKLQIQVEQDKSVNKKGLTDEQVKFYKLSLDAQSQKLNAQIDDIIQSLLWTKKAQKSKVGKFQISDMYKQIDADTSALKQQVKQEKERLSYMRRANGLAMLLGHGAL